MTCTGSDVEGRWMWHVECYSKWGEDMVPGNEREEGDGTGRIQV